MSQATSTSTSGAVNFGEPPGAFPWALAALALVAVAALWFLSQRKK